jgi:hypothetical protein
MPAAGPGEIYVRGMIGARSTFPSPSVCSCGMLAIRCAVASSPRLIGILPPYSCNKGCRLPTQEMPIGSWCGQWLDVMGNRHHGTIVELVESDIVVQRPGIQVALLRCGHPGFIGIRRADSAAPTAHVLPRQARAAVVALANFANSQLARGPNRRRTPPSFWS